MLIGGGVTKKTTKNAKSDWERRNEKNRPGKNGGKWYKTTDRTLQRGSVEREEKRR